MAELADALDLGSSGRPCRFKSCYPQLKTPVFTGVYFFGLHNELHFPKENILIEANKNEEKENLYTNNKYDYSDDRYMRVLFLDVYII